MKEISFGERLKELREGKELSQIEFAQKIRVAKSAITPWEKGQSEPVLSNLIKISQFFGVSIDYLAGLED